MNRRDRNGFFDEALTGRPFLRIRIDTTAKVHRKHGGAALGWRSKSTSVVVSDKIEFLFFCPDLFPTVTLKMSVAVLY